MSARRWAGLVAVGAFSAMGTFIAVAPASLADVALARASLGRVRLAEAQGTLWQGSGRIVLADAPSSSDAAPDTRPLSGFAFPGTLRWQLRPLPLLVGLVDASVALDVMPAPVRVSGNPSELRIGAGAFALPSVSLARLGSPWNTIRPSGALGMRWDGLVVRHGVLDGRVDVQLSDVASAMTPVRPLGDYAIAVRGDGQSVTLALSTQSGPLQLDGEGSWSPRRGLRFNAQARAEGDERARLQSLLALIGRRDGDRTIIRIGG